MTKAVTCACALLLATQSGCAVFFLAGGLAKANDGVEACTHEKRRLINNERADVQTDLEQDRRTVGEAGAEAKARARREELDARWSRVWAECNPSH